MKTSPVLIFVATLLFSVAGFFLRLTQLSSEMLPNGFLAEGSWLHIVLLALTAVLLLGLILLLRPLEQRARWCSAFSKAPFANILLLLAALGILVSNLLLIITGNELPASAVSAPRMIAVLNSARPAFGIIAAACVAAFAIACLLGKKASPLYFMIVSVYLTVRLILHFQRWNTDPSIHTYGYQLLAAICTMLGSFQLAGFSFDKGKRRICLFWCLCAIFFCSITGADCLRHADAAELLVNLSLLLVTVAASFQLLFSPASLSDSAEASAEERS